MPQPVDQPTAVDQPLPFKSATGRFRYEISGFVWRHRVPELRFHVLPINLELLQSSGAFYGLLIKSPTVWQGERPEKSAKAMDCRLVF